MMTEEERTKRRRACRDIRTGMPTRKKGSKPTIDLIKRIIRWRYRTAKFLFNWTSLEHEDMKDLIIAVFDDLGLYGPDNQVESHEWYEVVRRNFHSDGGLRSAETKKAGLPVKRPKIARQKSPKKNNQTVSKSEPAKQGPETNSPPIAKPATECAPGPAKKLVSRRKPAQADPLQNMLELDG